VAPLNREALARRASAAEDAPVWFVYVLLSSSGRTYVGMALDVERRLLQHNGEARGGARSTRAGRPWRVGVTYGPFEAKGDALRAELSVKKLRGARRLTWRPA
jgi:putative endonuclease